MYKSVKEIQALIEESKNRKYMSISDKNINEHVTRRLDPVWLESNRKNNALKKDPSFASKISKEHWKKSERKIQHRKLVNELTKKGVFKKSKQHANKIAKTKMKSPIMTPFGEYNSFHEFLLDYPNINVRDRLRLNPHQYYYTVDGPGNPTYEDVYYSPFGVDKYMLNLFNIAKVKDPENTQCKSQKDWFYKMRKKYPDQYYSKREVKREWDLEE